MRSSPERLNLKPRLARPSEKKTKKRQSEQKGRWKAIQLCLKDIAWSDQLRTKRKGNCKSVYLYEKVHILCIQWNTHLSKRGDGGFNSPFSTVKATIPVRTLHHQVHQEKKNECNICYALGQNQPWFKFIFLLPRNGKDYQNEFFAKEKYNLRSVPLCLLRRKLDSNKHILTQNWLWLNRGKAKYRQYHSLNIL